MKQIDICMERAFAGKKPLKKKWKAKIHGRVLYLFHYTHLIMMFNVDTSEIAYEWWEKPTDKRGLIAAKNWLKDNREVASGYGVDSTEYTG